MMKYIFYYLIIINIVTFISFGLDKLYAIKNMYRIRESTLISLCILGGTPLGYIGMKLFRHKTKKPFFKIGIPLIFIIQLILIVLLIKKIYIM